MRYLIVLTLLVGCARTQPIEQKSEELIGICQYDIPGWDGKERYKGGQFVTVDAVDPPEFKEMVRVGIEYWNYHRGSKHPLLIYEPLLPFESKRPAWVVVRIVNSKTTSTEWGLTTAGRATIFKSTVNDKPCISGSILDIDPNVFYSLYMSHEAEQRLVRRIIHELGHALGIPHSWQEGTVMFKESGTSLKLGDDSKDALRVLYGQ